MLSLPAYHMVEERHGLDCHSGERTQRRFQIGVQMKRLALAVAALLIATHAFAQGAKCGARAKMVETITSKFKESHFAVGVISKKMVYEVFVSRRGSWTILVTSAIGKSCVVAVGTNWSNVPLGLSGEEL